MGIPHIPPPPGMTDPEERLVWNVDTAVKAGFLPPPPPHLHGEELRAWATAGLEAKSRMYGWLKGAVVAAGGLVLWYLVAVVT